MEYEEVIELLKSKADARGIAVWERVKTDGVKDATFGIGITKLRAVAKMIKKNHELALQLWESGIWDAKILAIMIEEPKKVNREQIDRQIVDIHNWLISAYYCELIAATPFAKEYVEKWKDSKYEMLQRAAYCIVSMLAKDDRKIEDEYFIQHLDAISHLQSARNLVKEAMNNCLFYIGGRNKRLNNLCLDIAKQAGKINVDYGDNSCQAIDVVRHLSTDRLKNKLETA